MKNACLPTNVKSAIADRWCIRLSADVQATQMDNVPEGPVRLWNTVQELAVIMHLFRSDGDEVRECVVAVLRRHDISTTRIFSCDQRHQDNVLRLLSQSVCECLANAGRVR